MIRLMTAPSGSSWEKRLCRHQSDYSNQGMTSFNLVTWLADSCSVFLSTAVCSWWLYMRSHALWCAIVLAANKIMNMNLMHLPNQCCTISFICIIFETGTLKSTKYSSCQPLHVWRVELWLSLRNHPLTFTQTQWVRAAVLKSHLRPLKWSPGTRPPYIRCPEEGLTCQSSHTGQS